MRMVWAFSAESLGKGILAFVIGGLTLLCGIALIANPLLASGVLFFVGLIMVTGGSVFRSLAKAAAPAAP